MTHACCPGCRLRFSAATAAYLVGCPECGQPIESPGHLESTLGFRLFAPADKLQPLPQAIAVSVPVPEPGARRP